MTKKLVSASTCEQQAVIQLLNKNVRNENKIHERLCNVYTKAMVRLSRLSDSVNEEICRIVRCLPNNDLQSDNFWLTPWDSSTVLSQMSIYWILKNELEMTRMPDGFRTHTHILLTCHNGCSKILNGKFLNPLHIPRSSSFQLSCLSTVENWIRGLAFR